MAEQGIVTVYTQEKLLFQEGQEIQVVSAQVSVQTRSKQGDFQLRQAKKEYFCNLNTSNTKQFWKTIKVLNKQGASIGSLTQSW